MAKSNKNRFTQKKSGSSIATLVILALVLMAAGGFWLFSSSRKAVPKPESRALTPTETAAPVSPFINATAVPAPRVDKPAHKAPGVYPETTEPPEEAQPRQQPADGTALLAIVIDDMGSSMSEARSLAAIGVPLTFSVIPGLPRYREVASFAASSGIDTMIHLPMQSKEWPGRRLDSYGLLVSMGDGELR
ncbi:MAG: divergent polysaccharide deacetylase family protein, partial [Deltaproteobacteria bacterium]|nr:divergent polysaccharide deacetylase family protein [Deltaproteobacteria bacterium]